MSFQKGEGITTTSTNEIATPVAPVEAGNEPVASSPGGAGPGNTPVAGTGTTSVGPASSGGGPFAPTSGSPQSPKNNRTSPVLNSRGKNTNQGLGGIGGEFESGNDPGAIGNDKTGGFSYGEYQIATKPGTFDEYMGYLEENNPDVAAQLESFGGADAARRGDPEFQSKFSEYMRNNPAAAATQHDFIQMSHFEPQRQGIISKTGIDVNNKSQALQDTIWSTATQHNHQTPDIVARALNRTGKTAENVGDKELIGAIYDERGRDGGKKYFPSSDAPTQASVANRFINEKIVAQQAFDDETGG